MASRSDLTAGFLAFLMVLFAATFVAVDARPARAFPETGAFGAVQVNASGWMVANGGGATVYSNGDTNTVSGNYSAPAVGMKWQCVELTQRLYQVKGWHRGLWSGVGSAYQIYGNARANGLQAYPNDGSYTPVPGDMIVHNHTAQSGAGHVAVVDKIVGNTLYAVEQNVATNGQASPGRATYALRSGTLTRNQNIQLPILGVVHDPDNTNTNSGSPQSAQNVQHVYSGTSAGTIHETYWGGGNTLTTSQLGSTGNAIKAVSSFVTGSGSGLVQHVFTGTADGKIYETYWGGGNTLTTSQLANLGRSVTSIWAVVTSDGVYHVFTGTAAGTIHETYWGGGNALTTYQLASDPAPITSVQFQATADGTYHVFSGATNGKVYETYWGGGNSLTSYQLANVSSSAVNALWFEVTSGGVYHVFTGTAAGTIHETYWGGGNSLTTSQLGNVSGSVSGVSFRTTSDGTFHVYSGTSAGGLYETYWGGGHALTTSQVGHVGSPVTSVASMITSSSAGQVQHIYSGAPNGTLYETYWGGGNSLTTAALGNVGNTVGGLSTQLT